MDLHAIGSVLIVDDHSLFRSGLARLLASKGVNVVGEAADGFEGIECAERLRPDIILMDIQMPHCSGLEATRTITASVPESRIIILTASEDDEDLFAAIRAGAGGYLLKSVAPDELVRMLAGIAAGEAPVSGSMASRLLVEFAQRQNRTPEPNIAAPIHSLTAREVQVLRCVATGNSNRQVALELEISENTVKNHMRSVLEKLHLANRVQAVAYAIRQGIVPDGLPDTERQPG